MEKISRNRELIISELKSWALTFEGERDDEGEPSWEGFDFVHSLAAKLENNQCTNDDYAEILFHIEQINSNEIRIEL